MITMICKTALYVLLVHFVLIHALTAQQTDVLLNRLPIGIFERGTNNAITDVDNVTVGHVTLIDGDSIRTGVTVILPHSGNIFQDKVSGAVHIGNAFGKLAGSTQVEELGTIETPIALTNTLSVAATMEGLIKYTLTQTGNENVRSVNALVGETNDGRLNDIRGLHVRPEHIQQAIDVASGGPVVQGNVGAGTGTICFGYKGGIGSSSRVLPSSLGGYKIGVLVQANFGGVLEIAGVPLGKELGRYPFKNAIDNPDGSCMIVVATDAPLDARSLQRLARRAMLGLAKTGGMSSNGSGDFVIAFTTHLAQRTSNDSVQREELKMVLRSEAVSPLFQATIEATEEAILNALFAAETMKGRGGTIVEAIDKNEVLRIMRKYGRGE